jgi:hypothetical protein
MRERLKGAAGPVLRREISQVEWSREAHSPSPSGRGQGEGNRLTLTPAPLPRWGEGELAVPSACHRGHDSLFWGLLRRILLALVFISACGRSSPAASFSSAGAIPPAVLEPASAPVRPAAGKQPASEPEATPGVQRTQADEELKTEEREANPTSENVTLTLHISPPVKAVVMWGAKQMAKVIPEKPSVELQRPRASGPLDLEIRAEGFLSHHTRLHSDRNDKVNVRLVREADAPSLFGYRSSTAATAATAAKAKR